jgi:hypothetical protein
LLGGTKTFQGTYPLDGGLAIAVDATGTAYVTGYACSADFPTTAQAFQASPPSACIPKPEGDDYQSAFVAKLNSTGTLLYSTYLGGAEGSTQGFSIGFDHLGDTFVGGTTTTGLFPGVTGTTVKPSAGFLSKLHPKLMTMAYTTFLGADVYGIDVSDPVSTTGTYSTAGATIYTAGDRYIPNSAILMPSSSPYWTHPKLRDCLNCVLSRCNISNSPQNRHPERSSFPSRNRGETTVLHVHLSKVKRKG